MTNPTVTTKLKVNLELIKKFGTSGLCKKHFDVLPFSSIELSDKSYVWNGCKHIMLLKPNTTLVWELEILVGNIPPDPTSKIVIDSFELEFKVLGENNSSRWSDVFLVDEIHNITCNNPLILEYPGKGIEPTTAHNIYQLSPLVKTCNGSNDIFPNFSNNLIYTINFSFHFENDPLTYCFILDPLIKNNSNKPEPTLP